MIPPAVEARILSHLTYDPTTGLLTWKVSPHGTKPAGTPAGFVTPRGYYKLKIAGSTLFVHRVIWFMTYGYWPKVVDHVDGDKLNNRLENLRETDTYGNAQNKAASSNTGFKGVSFKRGRFEACITPSGGYRHLGVFKTAEAAARAYDTAARQHFGDFARLNFPQGIT